ncbi:MAG: hypothetical protein ACR2NA_00500 [Solirubrobacterales bacterium]
MLEAPLIALAVAALAAGATGTWSPCGFSMVHTLGPTGHTGGPRTTVAAVATFTVGALVGGVATFGALSLLGAALHDARGAGTGAVVAAVVAGIAALAELRGVRIVPQIRRQVPEHWRRVMPMPVASGLYGVLLGLGFTTFVLTFAVWALAGVAIALGNPLAGLVLGVAFGVGRALPVAVIAPLADRPFGIRASELMAEQPAVLRGFRVADGLALMAVALALAVTAGEPDAIAAEPGTREPAPVPAVTPDTAPPALGIAASPNPAATSAASRLTSVGADPSVAGTTIAWQDADGRAIVRNGDEDVAVEGSQPAVGEANLAYIRDGEAHVVRRTTLEKVATVAVPPGAELAVSSRWLAWRGPRDGGGTTIRATALPDQASENPPRLTQSEYVTGSRTSRLSRPSVAGDIVAYGVASSRSSRLAERNLVTRRSRTLRRGRRGVLLTSPSITRTRLAFIRTSTRTQQLMVGSRRRSSGDRQVYRIASAALRDRGYESGRSPHRRHTRDPKGLKRPDPRRRHTTLWATALGGSEAFVGRIHIVDGIRSFDIVRTPRR